MDSKIYFKDILEKNLILRSTLIFDSKPFVFQQDSAPALKSGIVLEWCRDKLPDFIRAEEWPPYSPDLNPMDYCVWSYLEGKACSKKHQPLDSLKESLLKAWEEMPMEYVRAKVDGLPRRLKACIRARGGRFEI